MEIDRCPKGLLQSYVRGRHPGEFCKDDYRYDEEIKFKKDSIRWVEKNDEMEKRSGNKFIVVNNCRNQGKGTVVCDVVRSDVDEE